MSAMHSSMSWSFSRRVRMFTGCTAPHSATIDHFTWMPRTLLKPTSFRTILVFAQDRAGVVGGADLSQVYCQVNDGSVIRPVHPAYCTDALRFPLPSLSLPSSDHQSLRLVVFSLRSELPRCRRNVSHAWRRTHL